MNRAMKIPTRRRAKMKTMRWPDDHLIYKILTGSRATGLHSETSDYDIRGILIHPKEYILGLQEETEYRLMSNLNDVVYYGIKKFFRLALSGNPNALIWLWVDPKFIIYSNNLGKRIRANRTMFLSRDNLYDRFSGYARGQLRRMDKLNQKIGSNPERQLSFAKLGYDAKNACYLIQLLKMGAETLLTGEIKVLRDDIEDRQQLLDIRRGQYTYKDVIALADRLKEEMEAAHKKSKLPEQVDNSRINKLLIEILEEKYYGKMVQR
jgi:predicted nucleotidyltransferase